MHSYKLIRSKRKTMSLQINNELEVIVRAPLKLHKAVIESFVKTHDEWIEKHLDIVANKNKCLPEPDEAALKLLKEKAAAYIPQRTQYYAHIMNVQPTAIKINAAKTRFGSCSSKDRLNFSCRLMQYPVPAVDYVIVHELAHIIHKNHGKEFYNLIGSILPDYKCRIAQLKFKNIFA